MTCFELSGSRHTYIRLFQLFVMRRTASRFASGSLRINVFYSKSWKISFRGFWGDSFSFRIVGVHSTRSRSKVATGLALYSAIAKVNNSCTTLTLQAAQSQPFNFWASHALVQFSLFCRRLHSGKLVFC